MVRFLGFFAGGLFALAEWASVAPASAASPAPPTLWIERQEARPWLPVILHAADEAGLPPALLAEVIGLESGFQNVRNRGPNGKPVSSASGFGQQINGNPYLIAHHLTREVPADSILGAAYQFSDLLRRTGSIAVAARCYGTTAGAPPAKRQAIEARLERAARWTLAPPTLPATIMVNKDSSAAKIRG